MLVFFFSCATAQFRTRHSIVEIWISNNSNTHTNTRQDYPAGDISSSQSIVNILHTKSHAVCCIRTLDPSIRVAEDLRLNPHGRLYRRVPRYSYINIVCQWMSVRMLQNVITVRYLRHTCSRVSQTPVMAASEMTGPFFTYLSLFHEGILGSIMYETTRYFCEVF